MNSFKRYRIVEEGGYFLQRWSWNYLIWESLIVLDCRDYYLKNVLYKWINNSVDATKSKTLEACEQLLKDYKESLKKPIKKIIKYL